jgi:outer membrane protein
VGSSRQEGISQHEEHACAPTCPPYETSAGGIASARRHEEHEEHQQEYRGEEMKQIIAYVTMGACFALFSAAGAMAAPAATTTKIGVVDIQKFQKKSKNFQTVSAKLKKKFDAMQQKLDEERNGLIKLEDDFKKQSMMLSLDAQEDKKRELEKKRRYYKYIFEDLQQEMKDSEAEATSDIGKELEKIVKKIAEKEGYTLILEKRTLGLIYFSDAIDITDRVVETYDATKQKE